MTSEKFCLHWNDFESNIRVAFRELRDDNDFFDVTLACDDEQIQAHKVILSACSPFFRNVLRRNPHQHPLLYLKGVKFTDLQRVLNFMYHGEVNVAQEELNSFLAVAEDLRVKGLTLNNQQPDSANRVDENFNSPRFPPAPTARTPEREPLPPPPKSPPRTNLSTPTFVAQDDDDIHEVLPVKTEPRDPAPPVPQQQAYHAPPPATLPPAPSKQEGQLQQMDDSMQQNQGDYGAEGGYEDQGMGQDDGGKGSRITSVEDFNSYIAKENDQPVYYCTICSLFRKRVKTDVRNHVESKHFPGTFCYNCPECGQKLATKKALMRHQERLHS